MHNPILRAPTIEAHRKAHAAMELFRQHLTPAMLEESNNCEKGEEGEDTKPMKAHSTDYQQPEADISNPPLVTKHLQGQARSMNYRGLFIGPKHPKNFCYPHFKGPQLQEVYHHEKYLYAFATWGGRGKYAYIWIVRADPHLFWAQLLLHVLQSLMDGIDKREGSSARLSLHAASWTCSSIPPSPVNRITAMVAHEQPLFTLAT
jgi:hypothetical protein